MRKHSFIKYTFVLALIASTLACSRMSGASTTATPEGAASSVAGLGVPVTNGKWEVTITKVRDELEWPSSGSTHYTPKSGSIFLVVDVTVRNLDSTQATTISANTITLVDVTGESYEIFGNSVGETSIIYSSLDTVKYSNDQSDTLKLVLVFSVKKANIGQEFKFQFLDLQAIPFTVPSK